MRDVTVEVANLDCDRCARLVEKCLIPLRGVESVEADPISGTVRVRLDDTTTSPEALENWLADIGFTVQSSLASR